MHHALHSIHQTAIHQTAMNLCVILLLGISSQITFSAEHPNVLFIAVDDLNDWIGALDGHPQAKTPNLDRLAKRGVLFTNAHCAAPACNPSRAALMTGIRPSTSGVYHNPQPWRLAMPNVVTLPQHLMSEGYQALGGGKIYHGAFKDPASWNEYYDRPRDPLPKKRPVNGIPNTAHFDWGPVTQNETEMSDWKVTDWGINHLNKEHQKPFFLAVGLFRPHLPWYAPQKYFDMFPLESIQLPKVKENDLEDVPAIGKKIARPEGDHRKVLQSDNWKKAVQGYLASIAFTDDCIGRMLDALDKSAYSKNTIIVLWSDHGWHLGEKEHWRKFALWEEATRVNLMIVAPGVTQANSVCDRPVNLIDLYPTILDLTNTSPEDSVLTSKELEGTSLVPLLKDPQAKWDRPSLTTHGRNNHALRSDDWRYIRYSDGTEELYDHRKDPLEWNNLAKDSEFDQVKADLTKWFPKKNAEDAKTQRKKK